MTHESWTCLVVDILGNPNILCLCVQHLWQWSWTNKSLARSNLQYMYCSQWFNALHSTDWEHPGELIQTLLILWMPNLLIINNLFNDEKLWFQQRCSCTRSWQRREKCSWDAEIWNGGWGEDSCLLVWDREFAIMNGRDGQPWEVKMR